MGIFGAYVAYSVGKSRGRRRQAREDMNADQELCSVCNELQLTMYGCTYTGAVCDTCVNCCNCPDHS